MKGWEDLKRLRSAELDGCVGVVGCVGVGGHAELEGVSADGAPCEEEESLAEANDSNTCPKDLIGVLCHNFDILCQTFFLLHNPFPMLLKSVPHFT